MCRINALLRLRCCALPVCGFGEGERPPPLKALPKVDNVYVSGSADDQIRPEWEQSAARRVLGVEPVVISGAGHANIFTKAYAAQLADACVKGL